jgi:hypothetical protein
MCKFRRCASKQFVAIGEAALYPNVLSFEVPEFVDAARKAGI